jgi:hypothetical protein
MTIMRTLLSLLTLVLVALVVVPAMAGKPPAKPAPAARSRVKQPQTKSWAQAAFERQQKLHPLPPLPSGQARKAPPVITRGGVVGATMTAQGKLLLVTPNNGSTVRIAAKRQGGFAVSRLPPSSTEGGCPSGMTGCPVVTVTSR